MCGDKTEVGTVVDGAGIAGAYEVIKPYVRMTPTVAAGGADFGLPPFPLTLKLEQLQYAGSFKTRGAFANLLLREIPAAGVVAASGGNHGVAVAYAAMRRGVRAKIFVPGVASPAKTERIRACGADLAIVGERYADALEAAEEWEARTGALSVHAFDQVETMLGAGTVGLELASQDPGLDTVLVAVGGGGLIGGIAAWYAAESAGGTVHAGGTVGAARPVRPIRIIGVEPETAPTLTAALAAGRPVDAPAGGIAADSLAPRCVGELMFPIARSHVDSVLLVGDDAICRAQQALWDGLRVVVEPGGAAAFAALLSGAYAPVAEERVGVIVSGGNTTAVDFTRSSRST